MKINPPEIIREYVENEGSVPLVKENGSLWYSITEEEKESLIQFLNAVDSIPEAEWRTWSDADTLELAAAGNNAQRIIKNCIIRND